jgi:hypothetical protein
MTAECKVVVAADIDYLKYYPGICVVTQIPFQYIFIQIPSKYNARVLTTTL